MKIPGRNIVARPAAAFRAEWDRMAPRERKMVAGLALAVVAVAGALSAVFAVDALGDLADHNADVREALAAIAKHRSEYLEARSRSAAEEAKIGVTPPQVPADLEAAAREAGIQIPEQNERPPAPVGRRFVQHDVDFRLRQVDLQSLTRFLKRVETGPRLIFISRLSLKRRFSELDKLDAEITATAFERVKEAPKKKGSSAGRNRDKEPDRGDQEDAP